MANPIPDIQVEYSPQISSDALSSDPHDIPNFETKLRTNLIETGKSFKKELYSLRTLIYYNSFVFLIGLSYYVEIYDVSAELFQYFVHTAGVCLFGFLFTFPILAHLHFESRWYHTIAQLESWMIQIGALSVAVVFLECTNFCWVGYFITISLLPQTTAYRLRYGPTILGASLVPIAVIVYFLTKGLSYDAIYSVFICLSLLALYYLHCQKLRQLATFQIQLDHLLTQQASLELEIHRKTTIQPLQKILSTQLSELSKAFFELQENAQSRQQFDVATSIHQMNKRLSTCSKHLEKILTHNVVVYTETLNSLANSLNIKADECLTPNVGYQFTSELGQYEQTSISCHFANHFLYIQLEAIRNAVDHGHAKNLAFSLTIKTTNNATPHLQLVICDDGIGFSPNNKIKRQGGLANMAKRSRDLGGTLEFIGGEEGTVVRVSAPWIFPKPANI